MNFRPVLATWEKFHKGIHRFGLFSDDDPAVDAIMEDMATQQIVDIGQLLLYETLLSKCAVKRYIKVSRRCKNIK